MVAEREGGCLWWDGVSDSPERDSLAAPSIAFPWNGGLGNPWIHFETGYDVCMDVGIQNSDMRS